MGHEVWARAVDDHGVSKPVVIPAWTPRGYLKQRPPPHRAVGDMSGLLRFPPTLACILAHAVDAAEIDPAIRLAQSQTHPAAERAHAAPPQRQEQLPPTLRPIVAADASPLRGASPSRPPENATPPPRRSVSGVARPVDRPARL